MILRDIQVFKLKKTLIRVDHFMPAYDHTVVLVGMSALGKDTLMHIDKDGKILCKYQINDFAYSLVMPNDEQALVLNVQLSQIVMINLRTHKIMLYPFHFFTIDEPSQIGMEIFLDTNLLCIRQNGAVNDNRLILTYYTLPLPLSDKTQHRPVVRFESQDNQWTHEHAIFKGNNHSMMIWCRLRHDQFFEVKTFDTRDDSKGQFKVFSIRNCIGVSYGLSKVNTGMDCIWETKPGVFTMELLSELSEQKVSERENVHLNQYHWDTKLGKVSLANYDFDPEYTDLFIDVIPFGKHTMFRTFYFNNEGPQLCPSYFVHNETGSVIGEQMWKCTHLSKWSLPSYDPSIICEGRFENGGVDKIQIETRMMLSPMIASAELLREMPGEVLDEDLFQEVMSILSYSHE